MNERRINMSIYLIHAYEETYSGLHGMEDYDIVETDSLDTLRDYGHEMSLDVMESYGCIEEVLYQDALEWAEEMGYEEDDEEFSDYLDELHEDNVAYEYWKLNDEYTTIQYWDMLRKSNGDWEEIRDKYAVT